MLKYLEAQRVLLHDRYRLDAYEAALRAVVRPGDVVLDLGAGSGVLGWLALRAGASHVVAADDSPNVHIIRELAARHGLAAHISVHPTHSTRLQLPQPVDLVVCDQAGPLGWEGGLIEILHDAHTRLLRQGGRVMPCEVQAWAAPSNRPRVTASVQAWLEPIRELNFAFLADWASHDMWTVDAAEDGGPVADAQQVGRWHLGVASASVPIVSDLSWRLPHGGIVSGFEGWFESTLCAGHSVTNGPSARPIARARRFLPLRTPLDSRAGDELTVRILMRPAARLVQWSGSLRRDGRITNVFAADNFGALLRQSPALMR